MESSGPEFLRPSSRCTHHSCSPSAAEGGLALSSLNPQEASEVGTVLPVIEEDPEAQTGEVRWPRPHSRGKNRWDSDQVVRPQLVLLPLAALPAGTRLLGGLAWGLTQMQALLSNAAMRLLEGLAWGAHTDASLVVQSTPLRMFCSGPGGKGKLKELDLCSAPDLPVPVPCTSLQGPETANSLESGRAGPESQLPLFQLD